MRRKRGGGSQRRSTSRRRPGKTATPRGKPPAQKRAARRKNASASKKLSTANGGSGHTALPRSQRTNILQNRARDRRNILRKSSTTTRRLPAGVVPARPRYEDASTRKTTQSVCARKKQTRRAVIKATGYGGRNGFKNYKDQQSCRR